MLYGCTTLQHGVWSHGGNDGSQVNFTVLYCTTCCCSKKFFIAHFNALCCRPTVLKDHVTIMRRSSMSLVFINVLLQKYFMPYRQIHTIHADQFR